MIEKAEVTALLQQLTAIKSEYFHEDEIMAFARDWLCRQELPAQLHEYHDAKVTDFHGKNVIAVIDGGRPGPVICLNGHLDTVQLCGGWTRDPYGELDGDRLYGVGALDMKSGCAALMVTAARFAAAHKTFAGKIKLALVSDEEGPYGLGTNALIEDGYLSDVDFSIIAEPSAGFDGKPFPDVCLGARGGYGLEIRFYGKSAHAANPEKGHSALLDAAKVAQALEQVDYIEDPHLGKGTCCVVGINADGGACSVPDFAVLRLFWHIVVGESPDTIVCEIEKAVQRADITGRYEICFREAPSEGSRGFMPYTVPQDDPMTVSLLESIRKVTGTESFSTLKKEKQPPYNLNSGENRPYRKNSNGLTTPMNTANTSFSRFSCNYLAKNYRFTTQTISFHTKACSISFMISRINRGEIVREQNYYIPPLPFLN